MVVKEDKVHTEKERSERPLVEYDKEHYADDSRTEILGMRLFLTFMQCYSRQYTCTPQLFLFKRAV